MVIKLNISELLFEFLIMFGMGLFAYINSSVGQVLLICVLGIWITNKILKNKYSLYELLVLVVVGLFVGSNYLLYFGIVINAIYIGVVKKGLNLKVDLEVIGFAVMLVSGSISSFLYAVDKKAAYQYIFIYFLLFLFLWESKIVNQKIVIKESTAVSFFSMSSFLLGIGFFLTHTFKELQSLFRMEIFYNLRKGVGANTLAGIMAPFLFGCMLIVIESKDRKSRLISFLAVVTIAPILLTIQSRGVYLGIFIAVVWILLSERSPKVIVTSICFSILAIFIFFNNPNIFARFFGRFSSVVRRTGNSLNGRERLYKIAWDMFKEHPIIGNGFWQFGVNGITESDPHNFILAYLASTGIIGGVGFLLYLTAVYIRLRATLKRRINASKLLCEIIIVSYIIFVVHGCVEPSMTTQAPLSIFILMTLLPVRTEMYSGREDHFKLVEGLVHDARTTNKDVTAK